MIRALIIIVGIIALAAVAAVASPMVPFSSSSGIGPNLPNSMSPMIPNATGNGFPPPPVCSNELDFTQACNSQYIGAIL